MIKNKSLSYASLLDCCAILFVLNACSTILQAAMESEIPTKQVVISVMSDRAPFQVDFFDDQDREIVDSVRVNARTREVSKELPIQKMTMVVRSERMWRETAHKIFTVDDIARLDKLFIDVDGQMIIIWGKKPSWFYPGVKKINEDLYVGKVAHEFYVAMERVNDANIDMWAGYAKAQRTVGSRIAPLKYLKNTDGSLHFEGVLNGYKNGEISQTCELWIAYASNKPIIGKAKLASYPYHAENPSIEMFFTVITSPKALITSHMGISRTWEAAVGLEAKKRRYHPNQSMNLHSFAAKVMKMRDPNKVYMLTAPVPSMRDILLAQMPVDSVFVGDDIYEKNLLKKIQQETSKEHEERLEREKRRENDQSRYSEKIALLKTHPPRIKRGLDKQGFTKTFTILNPDGTVLVDFDLNDQSYQWIGTEYYQDKGLLLPYVLTVLDKLAEYGTLEH